MSSYLFRGSGRKLIFPLCLFFLSPILNFQNVQAQKITNVPEIVANRNDELHYTSDSLGNRIPDFSYCGYQHSEVPIPQVKAVFVIPVPNGDATELLQQAIDSLSQLPLQKNGFRGAIQLDHGVYHLKGRLHIRTSGIVIRGQGMYDNETCLLAEGTDRETLIRVEGRSLSFSEDRLYLKDKYVPVNAISINLDSTKGLKEGDLIQIIMPSDQKMIDQLNMNSFGGESSWLGWKPDERTLRWNRKIIKIEGQSVFLDVPLTAVLNQKYGKPYVLKVTTNGQISHIGLENFRIDSQWNSDNPKDEEHCWNGISFENVANSWVRRIQFSHLAGSAVAVYETGSSITVEDCLSLNPVSELANWRRMTFFNQGQQNLFLRLYAEHGYHDFSTGYCTCGPNAFVQCTSVLPVSFSGAADSWTNGALFDIVNVDGQALSLKNQGMHFYGAGWTSQYCMLWQCSASLVECFNPPGALNWAYGSWGEFAGNGIWRFTNEHVNPRSLFFAQLKARTKGSFFQKNPVITVKTNETSSPTPELAADLIRFSEKPAQTVPEFIKEHIRENPITTSVNQLDIFKGIHDHLDKQNSKAAPLKLKNGWLVRGSRILTGTRQTVPWWWGNVRPRGLSQARPAITRFVPGRIGLGYTDQLDSVTNWMLNTGMIGLEQHYALWYDRRRDDHERVRRMDGEVWAPFYELPFERSGKGLAWDGLSKYNLNSYNIWYWNRLKQFADLADQKGLLLIMQDFFQHNILEAGAHWVDSPWRTVNNINQMGFPEPVPFAGDKRVFMAKQFYDVTNLHRKQIYTAYIRQCLNVFKQNNGVIQMLSAEYSGPLHFMQFWLDVIADWEKENKQSVIVGLSAPKDVQDAVLKDQSRESKVNVIDIRYWSSRADGTVYAPKGGQNLAPRQHARIVKPGKRSFDQVYRDVLSYRLKYQDKAVIYSFDESARYGWAVFMAGGSLANIPKVADTDFLSKISDMHPIELLSHGIYELQGNDGQCLIYLNSGQSIQVKLKEGNFEKVTIHTDGSVDHKIEGLSGNKIVSLTNRQNSPLIIWIKK